MRANDTDEQLLSEAAKLDCFRADCRVRHAQVERGERHFDSKHDHDHFYHQWREADRQLAAVESEWALRHPGEPMPS